VSEVDGDFPPEGLRFADANVDGFQDVLLFFNAGNATNEDYAFWLFNPRSTRFEFNEQFTQTLSCNPSVDTTDHVITTGGTTGCVGMCYSFTTFSVSNGRLTLIERESQDLANDATDKGVPIFIRTLEKLQSGKLTLVARVRGTIDQIDRQWRW
jgi:hypothetical protein